MKTNAITETPKFISNNHRESFENIDEAECDSQILSEFTIAEKAGLSQKFETPKEPNIGPIEFQNSGIRLSSNRCINENNFINNLNFGKIIIEENTSHKNNMNNDKDDYHKDVLKLNEDYSRSISKEPSGSKIKSDLSNLRDFLFNILHPYHDENFTQREIKTVFKNPSVHAKR